MNAERWSEIIDKIKDQFDVLEETDGPLPDMPGSEQSIVFRGPMGEMKLQRVVHPKVDSVKTIGSRRIGSDTAVEKVYSNSETIDTVHAFIRKNGEWSEVDAGGGSLPF